ncbi:MAG: DUF4180 domain-containing protein [Pleomorphochaeta sp.]
MIKIVEKYGNNFAIVDQNIKINDVQDALDIMANAQYLGKTNLVIIHKQSLHDDFYNLRTKFAGDVLQKFSNYNVRLAIIGDFSSYNSKALNDFIYECNKTKNVIWTNDLDTAYKQLI